MKHNFKIKFLSLLIGFCKGQVPQSKLWLQRLVIVVLRWTQELSFYHKLLSSSSLDFFKTGFPCVALTILELAL